MSKIRVRSYLDGNAPQFNAAEKNGIIPFMKAMFEQESYGSVIPIGHQNDLVNNQLILEFDHNPGYSAGNLVQIVGSGLRSFTDNFFRVVSNDGARLYLKYDFNTLDPIPVDFNSTSLVVRHAPMDWEVLYSTDTQFSLRSKNENSSKNVITFKRPTSPAYETSAIYYGSLVHISKEINTSTGELVEDYFQKRINAIANNTESPYSLRVAGNYGNNYTLPLNNTTVKYPWYLVGDDRFFYLILGNSYNQGWNNIYYMNFNRNPDSDGEMKRSLYMFGDPDRIHEDDSIDPTGFIFNTDYVNPSTLFNNSNQSDFRYMSSDYPTRLNSNTSTSDFYYPAYFLRDFTNLSGDITPVYLHTMSF